MTRRGVAIPVVSASVTWSTPTSRARSTSAATSPGVIVSPSNGDPKQHEITASSTRRRAAARIAASSSNACPIVHVVFFSLYAGDAETVIVR